VEPLPSELRRDDGEAPKEGGFTFNQQYWELFESKNQVARLEAEVERLQYTVKALQASGASLGSGGATAVTAVAAVGDSAGAAAAAGLVRDAKKAEDLTSGALGALGGMLGLFGKTVAETVVGKAPEPAVGDRGGREAVEVMDAFHSGLKDATKANQPATEGASATVSAAEAALPPPPTVGEFEKLAKGAMGERGPTLTEDAAREAQSQARAAQVAWLKNSLDNALLELRIEKTKCVFSLQACRECLANASWKLRQHLAVFSFRTSYRDESPVTLIATTGAAEWRISSRGVLRWRKSWRRRGRRGKRRTRRRRRWRRRQRRRRRRRSTQRWR
jgi:hypothetical protein